MQNVTINNNKYGVDSETKLSLTNGALVIHRNRLGDVLGAYLVTSFRYNRGVTTEKAKEATQSYCSLINLDTGYLAFEERASRSALHRAEFKEHLDDVYATSRELIHELEEKFKTFNKADQKEILDICRRISQNIGCNQDFQISQFDRQMERSTTEAKGEIEAFFQNKVNQIAQQALVEDPEKLLGGIKSPVLLSDEDTPKPRLKKKEV